MQREAFHRKNGSRRLLICLLAAALILTLTGQTVCAADAQPETLRVGYFYNGDFMHKDENGEYAGYDIEYYYTIAGFANWTLRFVEYGSLNDALDAMARGEIDCMSGLSKTEERQENYLISNRKMCTAHIAVQTRAGDDRFTAGDTQTMTGLTCGILRGSNVVALYSDWCAGNGLTPHIVEYDSLAARNAALERGEVDAIAGGSTIEGAQKIAEFPSLDLYFMLNSGETEKKAQLDRAMSILALQNPTFESSLFEKYFPATRNKTPSFSAAEKAFLLRNPTLRVAVLQDDAPFSRLEKDGSLTGILPEYYSHLASVIGVSVQCVPCASKDDACAALSSGAVDCVAKFGSDSFDAYDRGVLLTVPYLSMNLVQVTRVGRTAVESAAVPQCNAAFVEETFRAQGSPLQLTLVSNTEESLAALNGGKVDSIICTQPAATWLLSRTRTSDYVVMAFGGSAFETSCAVRPGGDGNTLRSILNKTIIVDGDYISHLITADSLADTAAFSTLIDRMPASALAACAAVAVILFLLAAAALIVLIRRRSAERALTAKQARLRAEEEANKARHAFFGTVSHDMRTPLNGILGFANLALESGDPAEIRADLRKIRASGEVLSGLVNDTLILSRMENGKYVLNPAPCRTEELFGGVLEPIRALAAQKQITFADHLEEVRPRTVLADRVSVQKILLNLLTNAVKFTDPGGTVTLSCRLDPPDGAQPDTVVTVSDTGRGISAEFLPRIFEPFAQENAAGADPTGSGLGLSIVRSVVDAMGGTIAVKSAPGAGSTFTVRLPLPEAGADPATEQTAERFAGKRALVCDDNALNLEILRALLQRCGVESVGAENGSAGLKAFAESAPGWFDVVLLDLRMPVMDGLAAARAIRALERADAAAVPIFAVSADAFPENVQECLDAGMNGHISKPVDQAALQSALASVFR